MENAVKILSDKAKDKKIKNICWEYLKAKQQEMEIKKRISELQQSVKGCFKDKDYTGTKSFQFNMNGVNYKLTDVNPTKIIWDIEKLLDRFKKRKISKEITQQVIKKTYAISDWEGFVKLLSEKGMKADEVKPFISVETKVDQKAMDNLSNIGELTTEDVEGCYSVEAIAGSLKTTEWEEKKDDKDQS